ncbi:MAG: DNA repair protein RecO (recombination protein O) [Gammaproteobacteria bacterium]|jgi:DNA repair protein RecO (recombination protein O)
MQHERVDLEPSFIIHQRRYRETSLIVEVLTRDHGRVGLVARGARGPAARKRFTLSPFIALLLSWSSRADLGTLTQVETPRALPPLSADRLVSGLYLNELVYRLCARRDPYPEVFSAYAVALAGLREAPQVEAVLRVFELNLLDAIGYALMLDTEADTGRAIVPEQTYIYVPEQGPVPVMDGAAAGHLTVSGRTLLGLASEDLTSKAVLAEAKKLMRSMLTHHLGPRPLATREMFAPFRRPK